MEFEIDNLRNIEWSQKFIANTVSEDINVHEEAGQQDEQHNRAKNDCERHWCAAVGRRLIGILGICIVLLFNWLLVGSRERLRVCV